MFDSNIGHVVHYNQDPNFNATMAHFQELFRRYSSPILVLNLIKKTEKTPKEVLLGAAFSNAIQAVTTELQKRELNERISYCTYDFLNERKSHSNVIRDISKISG